jgi:uncharacterized protein YqhQ
MTDTTLEPLRLGGMALRNGLLVHGPTRWAVAARRADGTIGVASGRKPRLRTAALDALPGARGVLRLAEAMAVIPLAKRALPEARLPWQDPRVLGAAGATMLASAALRRRLRGPGAEAALAGLSLLPSLVALRGGDLAAYHGVEHKAIAAYESGAADARDAAKEHDRCGSHLVAPLLSTTVAGTVAARRAGLKGPAVDGAIALGSMAGAVEIFGWSERHSGSALARAFRRPGHELQRAVGTREPDEAQLEVGRLAMEEILRVEGEGTDG